jgi:hypothetical protein
VSHNRFPIELCIQRTDVAALVVTPFDAPQWKIVLVIKPQRPVRLLEYGIMIFCKALDAVDCDDCGQRARNAREARGVPVSCDDRKCPILG